MSSKMYKIGFIVLLFINVSLIVIFTMRPKHRMHQRGGERKTEMKSKMIEEMDFNDDQIKKFKELVNKHRSAVQELEQKESILMEMYFNQLNSQVDKERKEIILNEIIQLKREKIDVTFDHFEEVKLLCNEAQIANFELFLKRIVPRLTNSRRRPGS